MDESADSARSQADCLLDAESDWPGAERRIALLLASWGHVSPDMLGEVPPAQRVDALRRYHRERCMSEPLVMQGTTLVTPLIT